MTVFAFDLKTFVVTFYPNAQTATAWADANDGYAITKWEDLYEVTGFQLAQLHNSIAKELNAAHPAADRIKDVNKFSTKGAAEDRLKPMIMGLFELRGGAAQFADQPAAKKSDQPAAKKSDKATRQHTGINLEPKQTVYACREGSKQSILVDMLSRKQGATMDELLDALKGGGKPWLEVTVKSGLNWDMNKVKGYGIRTTKRDGVDCYHLVLPEGMTKPLPHKPLKAAAKG